MSIWDKDKNIEEQALNEKDVQKKLYGNINAELKSIRKGIKETKKKAYKAKINKLRKERKFNPANAIKPAAIIIMPLFLFVFFKSISSKDISAPSVKLKTAKSFEDCDSAEGKYTIQTAVYKRKTDAQAFLDKLSNKGYPAFLDYYYTKSKNQMYKVCVGRIDAKIKAEKLLSQVKKEKGAEDSFLVNLK